MRVSKSIAWQAILAVMVIAVGCAGAGAGSGGSPSSSPYATVAPISSARPIATSTLGAPVASGSPATQTESGAIGVATGPDGWEMALQGACTLTVPTPALGTTAPPSPSSTYVGAPYLGGTFALTLTEPTTSGTSGTPRPSSSPLMSSSPMTSSSPLTSPSPMTSSGPAASGSPQASPTVSVELTTVLDTILGAQTTLTPSPSPTTTGGLLTPDDVLPFAVTAENSQLEISVPAQFVSDATVTGGAIAPNARSGYVAADPGTGEPVFVNFVCLSLTILSAPAQSSPSPVASSNPAASGSPAVTPRPSASSSPAASSTPAPSGAPAASPSPSSSATP